MKAEKILNEVEKCLMLLRETIELNQGISASSWITGCHVLIASMFRSKDISHENYCQHMDETKKVTQTIWNGDFD